MRPRGGRFQRRNAPADKDPMAAVVVTRGEMEGAAPDVNALPGYISDATDPPWYCALHYVVGGLLVGLAIPPMALHVLVHH